MLTTLITSKTRVKILIKFFINYEVHSYLRSLESEFNESCNAIRIELNRFEKAGLLATSTVGNKKIYKANTSNTLCKDISIFLSKMIGIDYLAHSVIAKIPNLESAYLTGSLAKGMDSHIFDLVLVGNNINKSKVNKVVDIYEKKEPRKIRYLILKPGEIGNFTKESTSLQIWKKPE